MKFIDHSTDRRSPLRTRPQLNAPQGRAGPPPPPPPLPPPPSANFRPHYGRGLLLALSVIMVAVHHNARLPPAVVAARAVQSTDSQGQYFNSGPEALEWAGSNFTSYIADRESNKVWPAASGHASTGASASGEKNQVPPLALPPSSLEMAFFTNDPAEEEEEEQEDDETAADGQDEDEQEDEEDEAEQALAALLGSDAEPQDYDEQDEADFYGTNPVETIKWALKSSPPAGRRPARVKQPNRGFEDFDDIEALRLGAFYGGRTGAPSTGAIKNERQSDDSTALIRPNDEAHGASKRLVSESQQKTSGNRRERTKSKKKKKKKRGQKLGQQGKKKKKKKKKKRRRGKGRGKKPSGQSVGGDARAQQVVATRLAAPSFQRLSSGNVGANSCALVTQTGACVTFDSVEWALARARRLLGFARPEGLGSLEPSESTIHAVGELTEWTSRLLAVRHGLAGDELTLGLEQVDTRQTSLWRTCPRLFRSPLARQCYTTWQVTSGAVGAALASQRAVLLSGRYRTHTGQCNNPLTPHYGSSFMPFVRLEAPEYADGLGSIRVSSLSGQQLPPARLVSFGLHPSFDVAASDHSALFAAWGQLINHDLALASGARVDTGHEGSCCSRLSARLSDPLNRICMPIAIPPGDPVYGPHGVRCHDFKRSIAGLRPGCSLGPRAQLNLVTSFVDASFVYGSTRSLAAALRASPRRRGQLAMWRYFGARRQPLLPPQLAAPNADCLGRPEGLYCFRSGDSRTNQQVPLVALHTIHARQHNRLALGLAQLNPHWTSDRLYSEARHIHIAQVQHILLSEYLPELLGPRTMAKFGLEEAWPSASQEPPLNDRLDGPLSGYHWDHYEPTLNPGISQEFAAAAFRQGHSSVPGQVYRLDPVSRAPRRAYLLRELFRQPWALFEPGALDEFLAGLVHTPAQTVDPFVSLELTGHLLEEPDEPVGLDLIAINVQRGRDQGVAGYNSMRAWCGLGRLADFEELAQVVGNASAQAMASLYETVDDIDLYSGGLSEPPLPGGQLGATFACIVGHQFAQLRRADRYWFESSQGPQAFTGAQLASIKRVPLARLVCANTDALGPMQPLALRLAHPIYNPLVACDELPELDLSLWLEPPAPGAAAQGDAEEEEGAESDEDK